MTPEEFATLNAKHKNRIEACKSLAFFLHDRVGQHYGKDLPYGYHLQMVADNVLQYGDQVCQSEDDILPMMFGAYFHDTIEDARLTYNDVKKAALKEIGMTEPQALMAAEIVYALTDEKGRNREDRQNENYYRGIRMTPYAPLVKMADRLANTAFSFTGTDPVNLRMREVYRMEFPVFIGHIDYPAADPRMRIPEEMIQKIFSIFGVKE